MPGPSHPIAIVARRITGGPNADTPRYWFDNHPFKTHVFNALSSTFPEGERFFVRSVRHYSERIQGEDLQEQVAQFTSQEGYHGIEHDHHIDILRAQGYHGINRYIDFDKRSLNWLNRRFPRFSLAATAAIEHFTAILANQLLSHPERWIKPMHPDMRLLWQWHAAEETEHKAVAFDVFQQVSGSYGIRIAAMVVETLGLLADVFFRTVYFLYRDGQLLRPRLWAEGWRFVWGRKGVFGSVLRDYWRYYHRDFHPWDCDNYPLVTEFVRAHEESLRMAGKKTRRKRSPGPIPS
jgi:predicted metal-dependent hydrolase